MKPFIVSVSVLLAGCRVGELLSIRVGQVRFLKVRGKLAAALTPGGSKTDPSAQRATPIMIGQLEEERICPFRALMYWITQFQSWEVELQNIKAPDYCLLFPVKDTNRLVPTGLLTRKIQEMEKQVAKTAPNRLPKYNAHSGRVTIATLAHFAKDSKGQAYVSPELLEHQLRWKRGTQVLSNYLGQNAAAVKGAFLDKIREIRNEEREESVDEDAAKTFSTNTVEPGDLYSFCKDL